MSEILNLFNMTAQQVHTMTKENSVAESPIFIGGATIIPISKISCGFAAGGSEMAAKKNGKLSAGAGAKVTKTPLSFLAIIDGNLQVLYVNEETAKKKGIIDALKPMIQAIKDKAAAKKAEKEAAKAEETAK